MFHGRKIVDATEWKKASEAERASLGICKSHSDTVEVATKKSDGEPVERALWWTDSTEQRDRHGDRIVVAGWSTKNFEKNPVVPWAHNYSERPVAKAIEVIKEVGGKKARLRTLNVFPTREEYDFADSVYQLAKNGFLSAKSVGFIPLEWESDPEDKSEDEWMRGRLYTKCELLESSIVVVPSNPGALQQARTLGIDVGPYVPWVEKLLDEKEVFGIPRSVLEQVHAEVRDPKLHFVVGKTAETAAPAQLSLIVEEPGNASVRTNITATRETPTIDPATLTDVRLANATVTPIVAASADNTTSETNLPPVTPQDNADASPPPAANASAEPSTPGSVGHSSSDAKSLDELAQKFIEVTRAYADAMAAAGELLAKASTAAKAAEEVERRLRLNKLRAEEEAAASAEPIATPAPTSAEPVATQPPTEATATGGNEDSFTIAEDDAPTEADVDSLYVLSLDEREAEPNPSEQLYEIDAALLKSLNRGAVGAH